LQCLLNSRFCCSSMFTCSVLDMYRVRFKCTVCYNANPHPRSLSPTAGPAHTRAVTSDLASTSCLRGGGLFFSATSSSFFAAVSFRSVRLSAPSVRPSHGLAAISAGGGLTRGRERRRHGDREGGGGEGWISFSSPIPLMETVGTRRGAQLS